MSSKLQPKPCPCCGGKSTTYEYGSEARPWDCPVCGKKHFVNEARQRVAYGKQYSCGSGCEAVRRRAWRHAALMPAQVDTGVCHADAAMADDQRKARVGQLEQNDHLRRKRKSIFEES